MKVSATPPAAAKPPSRPSNSQVAALFLAAAALYCWTMRGHWSGPWMEDLPVYTRAVADWLAGRNPYNAAQAPLYFLYPPAFLFLAGTVSHLLPPHWGQIAYCLADTAALCALPLLLARYFFRQPWLSPWFALLLFFASPRYTGMLALRTMNVASMLYCLAFAAAVPGLRRNRWEWFYLAVLLAASIKITFVVLLLLPVLAGSRQWPRCLVCCGGVLGVDLAQRLLWPDLYSGYQWSLRQGIVNSKAFGYGVFGVLANYRFESKGIGVAAYAAAGLIALLLTGLLFGLRHRLEMSGTTPGELAANGVWLAMIAVAIVLVNPREMQYDMDIAIFASFVLMVYGLKARRVLVLATLLFLPSLVVPLAVRNPHLHGIYETMAAFAAFGLAYRRLSREAGQATARERQSEASAGNLNPALVAASGD